MNNKTNTAETAPELNHLGQPFTPTIKSQVKRLYNRTFARRQWLVNFADKQLRRNARKPGCAFSFRIFTGRCAA